MASTDTIFRPFRHSDAERSDRSAGDRLRHRQKVRAVDPREHRRHHRRGVDHRQGSRTDHQGPDPRHQGVPLRLRRQHPRRRPGRRRRRSPGRSSARREGQGQGGDDRAGDQPGVDYYETDVTLEELIDIMFEDLELPDLERKKLREIAAQRLSKRKGYRQVGIRVRLDKRRTVERQGEAPRSPTRHTPRALPRTTAERFPFHDDDLDLPPHDHRHARRSRTPSSSASWTPRARWTR